MKDLLTQQYLRAHGLTGLCDTYKITARRHGEFPNLVQLKYSQIDSPMGEPIVQECRGLIVDEADGWRVVAFPFRKFFNHGEGHAAPVDWTTARVYEKLDGSLMTLYWYAGEWRVASSGLPDAAGQVGATFSGTFADLFWKTWDGLGHYRLPPEPYRRFCFMFELMTVHNRIVCRQTASRLVLIGVRGLVTHAEHAPESFCHDMGWECVRSFSLACLDDCITSAAALNPMEGEGYVIRDAAFNRVKVKSPAYVALAHVKEGVSGRRLLEIVRTNESDEFLSYFPEFTAAYQQVRAAFDALCVEVELEYARLRAIPEQKAFAMEAVRTRCSSALFALRAGKCANVREFFRGCTSQVLERVIGLDLMSVMGEALSAPTEGSAPR